MSLTQGSKVEWADIVSLYTTLNQARSKFGFSTVTVPSNQNTLTLASTISTLNNFVTEMKSNSHLTSITTGTTVPSRGDLLKPAPLTTLQNQVTTAFNTCNFGNTSFGNSSFSNTSFSNTSFGNSSFSNTSFSNTSFGNSGWSFSNTSFGNTSFGNSSFSNTSFSNTSFGDTSWNFANGSFSNTSFGNTSFSNTSFSCSSWRFGNSSWRCSSRCSHDNGGFTCF